jgi:hypothetical protein
LSPPVIQVVCPAWLRYINRQGDGRRKSGVDAGRLATHTAIWIAYRLLPTAGGPMTAVTVEANSELPMMYSGGTDASRQSAS